MKLRFNADFYVRGYAWCSHSHFFQSHYTPNVDVNKTSIMTSFRLVKH